MAYRFCRTVRRTEHRVMMENYLATLRERAQQLKEKWPGYRDILDFYVKVREAQVASKVSLHVGPITLRKELRDCPTGEDASLIQREDFPVDTPASIALFHDLCRIGKTANPYLADQIEKIEKTLDEKQIDLPKLLTGQGEEKAGTHVDTQRGLDNQVLAFLIQNSKKPSIEAIMEQLQTSVDGEAWRKCHCPVCGSSPSLNVLKGTEGKRYSLCSFCGCEWRIERVSCAVCDNKEQGSLRYFYSEGEEAYRIDLCDTCHHYIKTIDYRTLEASDPFLEDLATLHLDVVAVQKGYKKSVPSHGVPEDWKK